MKKEKEPVFDLDEEEQELSDSFDRGEWKSVDNPEEEKAIAREAARKAREESRNGKKRKKGESLLSGLSSLFPLPDFFSNKKLAQNFFIRLL